MNPITDKDVQIRPHIVLSKTRCLPCRQLHSYLKAIGIDWETKWLHDDPNFFSEVGVKSAPTLIEPLGNGEYKIAAVGFTDIKFYIDVGLSQINEDNKQLNKIKISRNEEE